MKRVIRLVVLMGTSTVVACATSTPPTSPAVSARPTNVPVTASAAPATAASTELKPETVAGYQVVVIKGTKRYCRTETVTGSRAEKFTTCLTEAQLLEQQNNSGDFMKRQQANGAYAQGCTTGKGGGAMGCSN